MTDYDPADLDALGQAGELVWVGAPSGVPATQGELQIGRDLRGMRARLFFRGEGAIARDREGRRETDRRLREFLAGRMDEARRALARLLELYPGYRLATLREQLPLGRPEDYARYAEGLRLAGLPE